MYTLARRLCRSADEAEDVLQETFLEVVRSIARSRSWALTGTPIENSSGKIML